MKTNFSKQRTKFFLLNVASFAAIFLILGLIIINLVHASAYRQTDQNLSSMASDTGMINGEINRYLNQDEMGTKNPNNQPNLPTDQNKKFVKNRFTSQFVFWSKDGKLLNKTSLSDRISDVSNLKLDKNSLEKVVALKLGTTADPLNFHSITVKMGTSVIQQTGIAYVQIIENTDQISNGTNNATIIIVLTLIIFWIISIAISYFLSAKTMQPIIRAWNKQQTFVENASHELRTPLTIIQNDLQKLFTVPKNTIQEESDSIASALQETRRLNKLTTDLLTLARSDANEQVLDLEPVQTNELIKTVTEPFAEMANLDDKTFKITENQPQTAMIDEHKLHQVLVIFLDNAMKYTKSGNIIELSSTIRDNNWIISVKNNGGKISDSDKAKIFDRFHRIDSSRNKQTGGFGLGLAIAHEIIKQHHGNIKVYDWGDNGVDFTIRIPIIKEQK